MKYLLYKQLDDQIRILLQLYLTNLEMKAGSNQIWELKISEEPDPALRATRIGKRKPMARTRIKEKEFKMAWNEYCV